MTEAEVVRNREVPVVSAPWGRLQWLVSGAAVPGATMTIGRVTFKPGQSNPRHVHPNCDEVLVVVEGTIEHSLPQGGVARLEAGDCVVLPRGGVHNAKNIGTTDAVVLVVFDSPHRQTEWRDGEGMA
jgi:quercetin dioxygenase-like cupin family protein